VSHNNFCCCSGKSGGKGRGRDEYFSDEESVAETASVISSTSESQSVQGEGKFLLKSFLKKEVKL